MKAAWIARYLLTPRAVFIRVAIFTCYALACIWFMNARLLISGWGWDLRRQNPGSDSSMLDIPYRWAALFQFTVVERPITPGQTGIFRGELIEAWHSRLTPFPGVLLINPKADVFGMAGFAMLSALTVLLACLISLIISQLVIRQCLKYFVIQPQPVELSRLMTATWDTRSLLVSIPPSIVAAWLCLLAGMDTDGWDVFSLRWAWFPWQSLLIGCAVLALLQAISTSLVSVLGSLRAFRDPQFAHVMRCRSCGYPTGSAVCPECGPVTTRWQLAQRLTRPAWVRPALFIAIGTPALATVSLASPAVRAAGSVWLENTWSRNSENLRLNLLLRVWPFHHDDALTLEAPWSRTIRLGLPSGDEMLVALRHFSAIPPLQSVQLYGPLQASGLISAVGFRKLGTTQWQINTQVHVVKNGYLNPYVWHTIARDSPPPNTDKNSRTPDSISIGTMPRNEHAFAAVIRGARLISIECVESTARLEGVVQLEHAIEQQAVAQGLQLIGSDRSLSNKN